MTGVKSCKKITKSFVFCFIAMFFLSFPAAALSDDIDGKKSGSVILPVPRSMHDDHDFTSDKEDYYDVIGIVDDVQEDGIVIGDRYFKKSGKAKIRGARVGAHVGIVMFNGQMILCEPVSKTVEK
jgi:hypothetical protein